jgi:hypothetical protein
VLYQADGAFGTVRQLIQVLGIKCTVVFPKEGHMRFAGQASRSKTTAIFSAADYRSNSFFDLERYLRKLARRAAWPSFGNATVLSTSTEYKEELSTPEGLHVNQRKPRNAVMALPMDDETLDKEIDLTYVLAAIMQCTCLDISYASVVLQLSLDKVRSCTVIT